MGRIVKAGELLENAVRMAGFDPSLMDVPVNWRMVAQMAVNDGLSRMAAEKFPQTRKIEFRRYRPAWRVGAEWRDGHECWHDGAYHRLESAAAGAGETPPGRDGGPWRRLRMDEVAAFIEFNQPWEASEIEPGGIDVQEFAYAADPKYCPDATPIRGCRMTEFGVMLPSPAPEGVYVKFAARPKEVTYSEWRSGVMYVAGDLAYVTADKECYECVEDSGGKPPGEDAQRWRPVRIAAEWQKYLTLLAAAEIQTADQGRHQTAAAAEKEFERLSERYLIGCGENDTNMGGYA